MNINYFDTPQYKLYCVKKDYNHIGKAILFQLILSNIISVILVVPIAVFSIPNILSNPTEMIEATSKNMPIIMMFSMLVGNIVPYFICANCLNLDIPSLFKWKNKSVKVCLYASGLLLFSNIALSFVYNYLSEVLTKIGLNTQTPPLDYGDGVFNIVIMAVITCIIAPITEEVIFRGVMLN
ncbi:MAG: CPBP family intramembrane glutamic endopeptidase, partial [Oscillospiraceae bacterium]